MAKLNEKMFLDMGFKALQLGKTKIYQLTIDDNGLNYTSDNFEPKQFTIIKIGDDGYVLNGEVEISETKDLIDIIAKVMYNIGLSASFTLINE